MYSINDLLTLMARLREPVYGCPWDQAQTAKTIAPSTLEEAYEVVDAIEQGDAQQLKEELGDLLFQVIFYSQLATENDEYQFADIVDSLTAKLIRRHPHVFPDGTLDSRIPADFSETERAKAEATVKASWEAIKQKERTTKGHQSALDDVPLGFPAIMRSAKLQKRASSVGFDWSHIDGVVDKLFEECHELKDACALKDKAAIEDELGDLFFTLVNFSRHLKVDSETAIRRANQKFEQRFRLVEEQAQEEGVDLRSLDEMALDERWQRAKKILASAP